jgi:hypothetical protein
MALLLHRLGARIVVLVDAMAEAHQAEGIVLVLGALDESGMRSTVPISSSILSAASLAPPCAGPHRQAMPAAMQANGLAPTSRRAHRRGRGVLLVIGMQDEDRVQRLRQHRIDLVFLARHREAHAQEVLGVAQIVQRIHEGLAHVIFVGHGGDRRHLGDQAMARRSRAGADR